MLKKSLIFLLVSLLMLNVCPTLVAALVTTAGQSVTGITLDSEEEYMLIGDTLTLEATVLPENALNKTILWTTDNAAVAVVNDLGEVSAVGTGYATITAATEDGGYTALCRISVNTPTSISIMPSNEIHMYVDDIELCYFTVLPASTPDKYVYLSSSDSSVLLILGDVLLMGMSPGIVTVTATTAVGGLTDTCTVYVYDYAQSVSLNTNELQLSMGEIQQLAATVMPTGSNQKVNWHSSDESVATVSQDGDVTGVSLGTALITTTSVDGGYTDTCVVTVVEKPVTGVRLCSHDETLFIGDSLLLTAEVEPCDAADKRVLWSSDNTAIAQVDQNGQVTGIGTGQANITVTTLDGGYTDTCRVDVVSIPVTGVLLNVQYLTINIGETMMLIATVEPEDASDKNVMWIGDSSVGSVDHNGLFTASNPGFMMVMVITEDGGFVDVCYITVVNLPVTGVRLNANEQTLHVGDTTTLVATVEPVHTADKRVTWQSSNEAVATVDQNGEVTATGLGHATVTVTTTDGGFTDACQINVVGKPVTGVCLNTRQETLQIGDTVTLLAEVEPADAADMRLLWQSSNEAVATVDQNGLVSAVSIGSATISVVTEDGGHTDECDIQVVSRPVTGVKLDIHQTTIDVGEKVMLAALVEPHDATEQTVIWLSHDTTVADVNQNGEVIGKSAGTADITVTTIDGGYTDTCSVTVVTKPVTGVKIKAPQYKMPVGDTMTLEALIEPHDATDQGVLWICSNQAIATIDQNGVITAHRQGSVTIILITDDSGFFDMCDIMVEGKAATGVRIDIHEKTMRAGETLELAATVEPEDAENKRVDWQSSNEAVATVDQNGLVTAISAGVASITATLSGGHHDTCHITVTEQTAVLPDQTAVLICSDYYSIDRAGGFLKGIKIGTSPKELKAHLSPEANIEIYRDDALYTGDMLASGMRVKLVVDGVVKDELTMVIAGDVNADGVIDISDITQMRLDILKITSLAGFALAAADVNNDGIVDISDYTLMRLDILELRKIHG